MLKATIINNLLTKVGMDWGGITQATGVDQQQYFQMKKEYDQLIPASC